MAEPAHVGSLPPGERVWKRIGSRLASGGLVLALSLLAHWLTVEMRRTPLGRFVDFPLWAAGLGLAAGAVLGVLGVRERLKDSVRTELFLKTALVLLGAGINVADLLQVGVRGLVQAVILVATVFLTTWLVAGLLRLEPRLRAVLATAVSVGLSAAAAAAGTTRARREQLTYVTGLAVLFALPLMVLQPLLARRLGLPDAVAGAWIGGNIDTTAAVLGAGALVSEPAMRVAGIVKLAQNGLMGVVTFLLAAYWVGRQEGMRGAGDSGGGPAGRGRVPGQAGFLRQIWDRFPKFVLGFVAASLLTTWLAARGHVGAGELESIGNLRNWFLTLAFVCVGLETSVGGLVRQGLRPLGVYALATLVNTVLGLGVAWWLFG